MEQYIAKLINKEEIVEKHSIIDKVLNRSEYWKRSDFPGNIFLLQESFFRIMNISEKEKYAEALFFLWKKQDENSCKALEILSHIGKYLSLDINFIVSDVMESFTNYGNESFAIYLLDFFKALWNVCNFVVRDKITKFNNNLAIQGSENLRKQIYYTNMYLSCNPIRTENATVLLLIPEFLTSSSFLQQPLDFMETVSSLKNYNVLADVLDNRVHNYSLEQLKTIVAKYKIVVVTSCPVDMTQKYYLDYRYAIFCTYVLYLKSNIPQINLIIWGAHGNVKPEWVQQDVGKVNIVQRGTINSLVMEIIKTLKISPNLLCAQKETLSIDFMCVNMQWYYGRAFYNGITYQLHEYSILQLSKGCPYQCLFCYRHNGNDTSYLSLNQSLLLINKLIDQGIHNIFFIDSSFTLNREYILDLCNELIKMDIGLSWQCETRADLLDIHLLNIMKKAGCQAIWIGFESFDANVLEKNRKGITLKRQLESIEIIRQSDIECCGFIMLGMPGETIESLNNTVNFVIKNKIPISKSVNRCTVRPGSLLFDIMLRDYNFQINSFWDLEAFSGIVLNNISEKDLQMAEKKLNSYLQK